MKRPMRQIKDEADEKFKEISSSQRKVLKIEEDITLAKNRKSFENVKRLEDSLIAELSKRKSIEKELETLKEEAFSWAPIGVDSVNKKEDQ